MYLSYYQLDRKPFQITADPNFLWLGDKHEEALAVLRYALLDNKGFLLLTGDAGTGKTTLINALVNTLGEEVIVSTLLDPGMEKNDFFTYLGRAFQLTQAFTSKGEFIHSFSDFLNRAYENSKKVLLIIDECQRLSQELLEEIRLLSNIERQSSKLINIFFVGQVEFNSIILEPKNSALRQRISVNYDLKPLSASETGKYIQHRLKVAGAAKSIFNSAAVREVFRFSNGYPRLINAICDRALITGFIDESRKIGPQIIKECTRELRLQNQKSRPVMETDREKPAPASERQKPASLSRSPIVEKVLYTILCLLIAMWVAIAVYYYYPQYIPFQETPRPQATNPDPRSAEDSHIESGERKRLPEKIDSVETTPEKPAEITAPKIHSAVRSDPKGTPEQFRIPDPHMVIRIEFDGNNELSTNGLETLANLSDVLHEQPHLQIVIKGYSESQGSYRYNKKMSEFTANIVKGYLVGKGISSQRIEVMGMYVIQSDENRPAARTAENTQWVEIQFKSS